MGGIADIFNQRGGTSRTPVGNRSLARLILIVSLLLLCIAGGKDLVTRGGPDRSIGGVGRMAPGVSAGNIRHSLLRAQNFGNRTTFEKQWETAHWLEQELRKEGLDAKITIYPYKGRDWPNVIATISGVKHPDRIVAAIAHLDSISIQKEENGAPGADDNGSGIAVILELARLLRESPMERTVMLGIFGNEEKGQQGSSAFAREARQRKIDIQAVLNLDVLGYGRPHNPIYLDAVQLNGSAKLKLQVMSRMAHNFFLGLVNGKNSIKVVGRPANTQLVSLTSGEMTGNSNLDVRGIVKKDCG